MLFKFLLISVVVCLMQPVDVNSFSNPLAYTSRLFIPKNDIGAPTRISQPTRSQLSFSIRDVISTTRCQQQCRRRRRMKGIKHQLPSLSSSSSSNNNNEESTITANGDGDVGVGISINEVNKLKKENKLLQERLHLLQEQNDQLQKERRTYTNNNRKIEQRIILEDFEGEIYDTNNNYSVDDDDDEFGLSNNADPLIDEDEVCEYDDTSNKWLNSIGECPVEPNITFLDAMKSRAYWLVGLLALQSCSGFILSRNELLLQDHPVIIYFLTMLVGAGGNAGNQASVRVIRGLALGTLNNETQLQFLSRELRMAFALSVILSLAGFLRAVLFHTPFPETMAVTLALSMIVFSSICLGAILPLLLQKVGVDPAHSSTTIQVVMDILGVLLTVLVSTLVLDSVWGKMLIKTLGHIGL